MTKTPTWKSSACVSLSSKSLPRDVALVVAILAVKLRPLHLVVRPFRVFGSFLTMMAKVAFPSSQGQRAAKKRRTSNASRDEDDFIAPSDEEEDGEPPARSRTSSMSGSRSGMDVDSEDDDDEPVKKKSSKAKGGSKVSVNVGCRKWC